MQEHVYETPVYTLGYLEWTLTIEGPSISNDRQSSLELPYLLWIVNHVTGKDPLERLASYLSAIDFWHFPVSNSEFDELENFKNQAQIERRGFFSKESLQIFLHGKTPQKM